MVNEVCTIDYRDKRGQQQVDELLRQEGIRRDRNLSYTCGIFNADMELIATGSSFGNTLRCHKQCIRHPRPDQRHLFHGFRV